LVNNSSTGKTKVFADLFAAIRRLAFANKISLRSVNTAAIRQTEMETYNASANDNPDSLAAGWHDRHAGLR
jgi:hypothetical protein